MVKSPEISRGWSFDEIIMKTWKYFDEKANDKPCSVFARCCRESLSSKCYFAGSPCVAPCETLKDICDKNRENLLKLSNPLEPSNLLEPQSCLDPSFR